MRIVIGETEEKQVDQTVGALIGNAMRWKQEWFGDPESSLKVIANRDSVASSDVSNQIRFAFLAPDIVKSLLDGAAPSDLNAERFRRLDDLPARWSEQRRILGFPQI